MAYKLIVEPKALLEIKEAFDWYQEQSYDLGYQLLDEIESCYAEIIAFPEHHSYINHLYRRIKTKRFPYIIVYKIERDNVVINAVRHVKRKPL
jgi:toxin ParE1/3/4